MDQGSTKGSAVHNLAPTVTKFCVMWEGQALPHDTKFGNCRYETVDKRVIFIRSLIHGSSWSGLIKAEPGLYMTPLWYRARGVGYRKRVRVCWTQEGKLINTWRPRQNGNHFVNDIFTCISLNEYWDFTEVCFQGSNQQYSSIGSDNGLVPTRWQAIIWTNDGLVYRRICASVCLNELRRHSE